jgi:hypothetical protein
LIQIASTESPQAKYDRRKSQDRREIGSLPEVSDSARRLICRDDFRHQCETYHSELFSRAWSDDHLKAIAKLQQAVIEGGQFAFAMPRASGKTTLCLVACMWALLHGHRKFVVLIGAEAQAALDLMDNIRTEFENNDMLLQDFPEVIFPIVSLEGIAHRCNGQTLDGERTQMTWANDRAVLPTVVGSKASGAMLRVAGITGRIRGMISKTPDGKSIRPDLVIVDDPQTDDSARSVSQNDQRERVLAGAILGLAGPGQSISAVMPCTIIRHQDMAERILDRSRHPEWRGEKTRLVYDWPTNLKLWEQYSDIWAGDLRNGGTGQAATDFYGENRIEMDAGSKVAWAARFEETELSAMQHAWNLKLRVGEEAFNSEYQNEPDDIGSSSRPITLTSDDLTAKTNKVPRSIVPNEYQTLTAFIDISQKCLWWTVCAFDEKFGGAILDYGLWPDQKQRYSRLQTVTKTLQRKYKGHGMEAAILNGLEDLTANLSNVWRGETGTEHRIEKILIDEGDGEHTQIVRNFCRRSELSGILIPAKGRGVKASTRPLCDGRPKQGERFGHFWKMIRNRDNSRTVHVDVNYWKTFLMRRFEVPTGDDGAVSLYHARPREHQMIADQLTAEYPKEIEDVSTGNRVIEWANPRNRDNHFMDTMVGCLVGASISGCTLTAQQPVKEPRKRRKSVSYI